LDFVLVIPNAVRDLEVDRGVSSNDRSLAALGMTMRRSPDAIRELLAF